MKRCIPFVIGVLATATIAANAWSQTSQPGRPGSAGGAGTSGSAGTAGRAGTSRPAGTPGTAGTAGTAGRAGTIGAVGSTNASAGAATTTGRANFGANSLGRRAGFNGSTNVGQTPLFADPGARQQLNMSNNQYNRLNSAYQDAYGRYNRSVSGLANDLPALQREQQMQQYVSQFYDDLNTAVDATITDPQHRARYDQLSVQYMGSSAFNDPAVQRAFDLLPQQLVQIRQLEAVWRQKLMQMERGTGADANNMTPQQWSQMYSQHWDQLNAVLTPEQQQLWLRLTGQPYVFSPNIYAPSSTSTVNGAAGGNSTRVTPLNQSDGTTNSAGSNQTQQKESSVQGAH